MPRIVEWSEIKDHFRDALILGNGASIALHEKFNYQSLFEEALEGDPHFKKLKDIFEDLETKDFEYVLRMLSHATRINEALGITETKTERAYASLRTALVKTVKRIHPAHSAVSDNLPRIAKFMKRFKFVLSLNYDLLVYWAMLLGNDHHKNRFMDCFNSRGFVSGWKNYAKQVSQGHRLTLVFYPHGNLALATDVDDGETKLTVKDSSSLLETVTDKWKSRKYFPLFVSEGTSAQKLSAINRSPYLKTVHDTVLPNLGRRIAILGWSMGDHDKHILKAICRSDMAEVAVGVVTSDSKLSEIKSKIQKCAHGRSIKVVFFEANSQGCWLRC